VDGWGYGWVAGCLIQRAQSGLHVVPVVDVPGELLKGIAGVFWGCELNYCCAPNCDCEVTHSEKSHVAVFQGVS
jgi:hypothetical protein